MRWGAGPALVFLALFATCDLRAAEQEPEAEEKIPAAEEIVIVATRVPGPIADVPNSLILVEKSEVDSSTVTDVGGLIDGRAGVDVRNMGTPGTFSGVQIRGTLSSQSLVLIDGRPVNSLTFGSADLSGLPLSSVERIEILKGPSSHLYGTNALGGTISIVTPEPPEEAMLRTDASYGSFDTLRLAMEHGNTIGELGYLFSAELRESDGHRDNSDYQAQDLFLKIKRPFADAFSLSYTVQAHEDDFGVPGPVPPQGVTPPFGNDDVTSLFDRNSNSNLAHTVRAEWEPVPEWQVISFAYYDRRDLASYLRYQFFTPVEADYEFLTEIYGFSTQASRGLGEKSRVTTGVELRDSGLVAQSLEKDLGTGAVLSVGRWTPSTTEVGLWGLGEWQAAERLRLFAGLRHDEHSAFGSQESPNVGAVYQISPNTRLKATAGSAYRAPTFNDLFFPMGGNPDLEPERSRSYELSIAHDLRGGELRADASAFYWNVDDKIQWAPTTDPFVWSPQNVNKQYTAGFEVGLRFRPVDWFAGRLEYNYLDSTQKNAELIYSDWMTGAELTELRTRRAAFVPAHQVGAKLTFSFPKGTSLDAYCTYKSDRVNYYSQFVGGGPEVITVAKKLDPYVTIDTVLGQKISQNADAYISVTNLLDAEVKEQFGTSLNDRDFPLPGRALSAGFRLLF